MANKAKILTVEQAKKRYKKLPKGWLRAAGLLKDKKVSALAYQKRVRAQWDR